MYIPRIGPHISCKQNRQIDHGNILIAQRHMNLEIGTVAAQFFSGNICFQFLALVLCTVVTEPELLKRTLEGWLNYRYLFKKN
jgi:hypothetical protein